MKKFLLIVFFSISNFSFADALDSFIATAHSNANKFESEISNLNRIMTFKYKPIIYWPLNSAKYDPTTNTLSLNSIFELLDGWIERCAPISDQMGVNGFGAKIKFTRYKCSQVVLKDEWNFSYSLDPLETAKISLTPSEYRALKADSPTLEVTFYIKGNPQEEVFKSFDRIEYATVRSPKEKIIKGFQINGQLKKITIFMPDGKKKLASFERMFCSDDLVNDCVTK